MAVHYTVGKICNNLEEELEITFSKHVIAVISEATFKQTGKIFYHCGDCHLCKILFSVSAYPREEV